MNHALRTSALSALLAVGLATTTAHATSTMATGVAASSLNSVNFTLPSAILSGTPTFSAYLTVGSSQWAPLSLTLFKDTTPLTNGLPSSTPEVSTLSFRSLTAGTYSLVFTGSSLPTGTTFTVLTSLSSADYTVTSVAEPESYALALAGVGLVGTLLSRRRSAML